MIVREIQNCFMRKINSKTYSITDIFPLLQIPVSDKYNLEFTFVFDA